MNTKCIIALLCLVTQLICSVKVAAKTNPAPKNWTIMIYISADNDLDEFAKLDLEEMISVTYPEDVNVIVQIDRSSEKTWARWSTCRRLDMRINRDYKAQYIEDIGEINTGDPNELTKFIDWTVDKYPASHYGLIIWSHGDGWRKANFKVPVEITPKFKAIAPDASSGKKLYLHGVSTALKKCKKRDFSRNKLDFIGFDACLMGMLEVCYEMKDLANYCIGSEHLEPPMGWPYDLLFNNFSKNKSDLLQILRSIVNDYGAEFLPTGLPYTLSAIDLGRINDLSTRLSALTTILLKQPDAIRKARGEIRLPYGFEAMRSWPNGIDLKKFLLGFIKYSLDTNSNERVKAFLKIYDDCIINNVSDKTSALESGSYGLGIYFPETKELFDRDPDGKAYSRSNTFNPILFVKQEKWVDFLNVYYTIDFTQKKHDTKGDRVISPLNPKPTRQEYKLYKDLADCLEKSKGDRIPALSGLILKTKNEFGRDSNGLIITLRNVLPAYLEDTKVGIVHIKDVEDICKALKKSLSASEVFRLNSSLLKMERHIDGMNRNDELIPPAYGVLCALLELCIRLDPDKMFRMAINMSLADRYSDLQEANMLSTRQFRTGLNITRTEEEDRSYFAKDICFHRALQHYQTTLDYISTLKFDSRSRPGLQYLTYYMLMKMYSRYPFLHDSTLGIIDKLKAAVPQYHAQPGNVIKNSELLNIGRTTISNLYRSGRYNQIPAELAGYYRLINDARPKEKILLNNGAIDMEAVNASAIFPNATIFASPGEMNKDLETFDMIISSLYKDSSNKNRLANLVNALEHARLVEGVFNMQVVSFPGEYKIYKMIDNIDSVKYYEQQRILDISKKEKLPIRISPDRENLIYLHYSTFERILYVLMKNKERFRIDTVSYPELFETTMLEEGYLDNKYELARETRLYSIISSFFPGNLQETIFVVPHSFMFTLPLDGVSDGQHHYLLDTYGFEYIFNLQGYQSKDSSFKNKKMLLVASPAEFSATFPLLSAGFAERDSILALMKNEMEINVLSDSSATDINVIKALPDVDILHFACHSYYTAQIPHASGIVLNKTAASDGILTAYEFNKQLKQFRANYPLVVLSSCKGAAGSVVSNGSLGLTYTLLQGGNVTHVVSSTQDVNDYVGSLFMRTFYKNLSKGNNLSFSVQQAKLKVRELYPSRAFWCNFNVYGQ